MWRLQVSPDFKRDYRKRCAKNKAFKEAVDAKVAQIQEDPLRFKPLRKPLHGLWRVHVMGSFVLIYEPLKDDGVVRLLRLAHHDDAYGY